MTNPTTGTKSGQGESSIEDHKKRLAEAAGDFQLVVLSRRYERIIRLRMDEERDYLTANGVSQEEISRITMKARDLARVPYLLESLRKEAAAYRTAMKEGNHELAIVLGWYVVCLHTDLYRFGAVDRHEIGAATLGLTVDEYKGLNGVEQRMAFQLDFCEMSEKFFAKYKARRNLQRFARES